MELFSIRIQRTFQLVSTNGNANLYFMQICLLEAEKRTQDMIRIIGRGAPHGKGGTSLPTSAAVGRVIGENGKKLAFLLVLL